MRVINPRVINVSRANLVTALMEATAKRLLADIEELAPRLTSRTAEIEEMRRMPPDLVETLRSIGVFRMFVPQSHGGLELELPTAVEIIRALCKIDGSVGWIAAAAPIFLRPCCRGAGTVLGFGRIGADDPAPMWAVWRDGKPNRGVDLAPSHRGVPVGPRVAISHSRSRYLVWSSLLAADPCNGAFGTIRSHPDRPGKMPTLSD